MRPTSVYGLSNRYRARSRISSRVVLFSNVVLIRISNITTFCRTGLGGCRPYVQMLVMEALDSCTQTLRIRRVLDRRISNELKAPIFHCYHSFCRATLSRPMPSSVRPSVRPSVTFVNCIETTKHILKLFFTIG